MRIHRASERTGNRDQRDTFTGAVHLMPIASAEGATFADVFFEPGARTFWHSHEGGQILRITSGRGYVCAAGGTRHVVSEGDLVWTPPGEEHWHGGGPESCMSHLAISLGQTTWGRQVTEAEFTSFQLEEDSHGN